MSICFSLHKFSCDGKEREGHCTSFLNALKVGESIRFSKPSPGIFSTGAAELKGPVVLIAHGTAIAPFISMLKSLSSETELFLFYGIRSPTEFLYKEFLADRLGDKICLACSRATDADCAQTQKKGYVQDTLPE